MHDLTFPKPIVGYDGLLGEGLAKDCMKLQLFFAKEGAFLGEYHIDRLHLILSPRALVNLGALVRCNLGRWDSGYRAGPLLNSDPTKP